MFCQRCGTQNDDNNYRCTRCQALLHPPAPPAVRTDDSLAAMIPYHNPSALTAYYLGVFSLIPFLGMFLGIAGFILGLKGLRFARQHPEARGKIHAWVGVLVGGFFGLLYLALTLTFVIAILSGE